ncbi:unnamed protein product [Arctogadus glacialis]
MDGSCGANQIQKSQMFGMETVVTPNGTQRSRPQISVPPGPWDTKEQTPDQSTSRALGHRGADPRSVYHPGSGTQRSRPQISVPPGPWDTEEQTPDQCTTRALGHKGADPR